MAGNENLEDVNSFPTKQPLSMPRKVTGYHGCTRDVAATVLSGNPLVSSTNTYDWLGEGVYFWEYAPYRALDWATALCKRKGGEPAVVGVTLRLGRCLNLLDSQYASGLVQAYSIMETILGGVDIPVNRRRAHYLDRVVIDTYCQNVVSSTSKAYQTVHGCYPEGDVIFPGSKILSLTHVQIAVRDPHCISDIHLVQF